MTETAREILLETAIPGGILYVRGKVRDTYDLGDLLLMIATDRISAFDVVLPNGILDKGLVLNQLSGFWFDRTGSIVPNHFRQMISNVEDLRSYFPEASDKDLAVLVGRSMIVKKAERILIECVVRGYLAGSAWEEYKESGTVAGLPVAKGLREGDELPEILFTPTTKAEEGHDEPITIKQMEQMVGKELAGEIRRKTLEVYIFAKSYAGYQGIIIADTKMEFGLDDGKLVLIDELLTPDSSRFWPRESRSQSSFDKQPVRDWLVASGWDKKPPAPKLPSEVSGATTRRYREGYLRLAGRSLK